MVTMLAYQTRFLIFREYQIDIPKANLFNRFLAFELFNEYPTKLRLATYR